MSIDSHQETIVIAAAPDEVYAVVSDISRVGEWSPVCSSCWWDEGAGPSVGSWFSGRNESRGRTWETRSVVTEAEPGAAFAWQVQGKFVSWAYRMAEAEGGTELTETWELNDATKQMFAEKYGDKADQALDQRREEALTGIPATLATLKQIIEGAR